MPNQAAAASTAPRRLRHKSAAAASAPNMVLSSPTTKIAARERNQFNIDQARPINRASIQKINSALPGEGSVFDEVAPAKSTAPTEPTRAESSAPARRKFRPMSDVSRQVRGFDSSFSRKYAKSVLRVAARPNEASTIQASVTASASTIS